MDHGVGIHHKRNYHYMEKELFLNELVVEAPLVLEPAPGIQPLLDDSRLRRRPRRTPIHAAALE